MRGQSEKENAVLVDYDYDYKHTNPCKKKIENIINFTHIHTYTSKLVRNSSLCIFGYLVFNSRIKRRRYSVLDYWECIVFSFTNIIITDSKICINVGPEK